MSSVPEGIRLYVSGLSDACRKEDLSDYFSEYSHNITDMWIARNPCGFAFIRLRGSREYVDEFVGKFANTELHSRTMNVEIARNQDGPRRKRGRDDSQYGTDRYYGASDRSRNYDDSRYGYSRNDGPRYEDRGYDRHDDRRPRDDSRRYDESRRDRWGRSGPPCRED